MLKSKMSICYPFGVGVSCICDGRGDALKCYPNLESIQGLAGGSGGGGVDGALDYEGVNGEALLSREGDLLEDGMFDFSAAGARRRRGLDERTEIILAATFLVLIVLAFVR